MFMQIINSFNVKHAFSELYSRTELSFFKVELLNFLTLFKQNNSNLKEKYEIMFADKQATLRVFDLK